MDNDPFKRGQCTGQDILDKVGAAKVEMAASAAEAKNGKGLRVLDGSPGSDEARRHFVRYDWSANKGALEE